ncbi:MAG: argininosuccinate lyase [Oscillospiraceae bacterium]|nr:argininosuccinate lyase [Oscillospiraceae bacterium]
MARLWEGRAGSPTDAAADDFNASIRVDSRMYRQDIRGSMAHAAMLGAQGIVPPEAVEEILAGLEEILKELDSGALTVDPEAEDIHSFVEAELTKRKGDAGRMLHTARSRNDQVAVDTRLYLRSRVSETRGKVRAVISALMAQAEANRGTVMPGYTHLQRAQPITFGHQLLAYAWMLLRDLGRLKDAAARMDSQNPLGACALAGTSHPIDREMTARELGFTGVSLNSLDAVSDRDFILELASSLAILMTHLSRLSEELILWSSWEFKFIELSDAWTTGSSIMPQKKNPDMAELIRGKTGRVYGDLMGLLTVMKGLPLAYNKDMQEDKEAIFDAFDTADACLGVLAPMLESMKVNGDNMRRAAAMGFINATDLADWLVEKKGVPFRTAYKLVGQLVGKCVKEGVTLEELPLEAYREASPVFDADLYNALDLDACVLRRSSLGGTAPEQVDRQLEALRSRLETD